MTENVSASFNGLSPEDVHLVQTAWVEPNKKYGETCFVFFQTFFKHHPEYRQLFPFRDVPDDEWLTNKKYLFHCKRSLDSFTSIINAIDSPDILDSILSKLRESHGKLNILGQQFIDFKGSFTEASHTFLNGKTEEIEAFARAVEVLTERIVSGFQ